MGRSSRTFERSTDYLRRSDRTFWAKSAAKWQWGQGKFGRGFSEKLGKFKKNNEKRPVKFTEFPGNKHFSDDIFLKIYFGIPKLYLHIR